MGLPMCERQNRNTKIAAAQRPAILLNAEISSQEFSDPLVRKRVSSACLARASVELDSPDQ
jgi:hypothetical protein